MKRFRISITCEVELDLDDLWPDGDAPDNPTEQDVRRLIDRDGGPIRILDDWNLWDDGGEIAVTEVSGYEAYWRTVLGPDRDPQHVIARHCLHLGTVDSWLNRAEAAIYDDPPDEWVEYHEQALTELRAEFRGQL